MGKSIIVDDMSQCLICGRPYPEEHHCIFGYGNRDLSDDYGLVIPLCHEHHRGNTGVHQNRDMDLGIKAMAQRAFEKKVGSRDDWMRLFGRNYL